MEPVEYLTLSLELRSLFTFFRGRSPCTGIRWEVENGATVSEGQTLGEFLFGSEPAVPIVSPIDGVLLRRCDPDGGVLHQRPSQLVAVFAPPPVRTSDVKWRDIDPRGTRSPVALLSPPMVEVEDNKIRVTWSFVVAPAQFAVTITELGVAGERVIPTLSPIALERRATPASVDWVATIELAASAEERRFRIRSTKSDPVDVGSVENAYDRGPTVAHDPMDSLIELKNLLDQQPDGGRDMLSRLMPSADPDQLHADIEAEIEGTPLGARPVWPFSLVLKPKVDRAALQAFCRAARIDELEVDEVRNTDFQTKEDWKRYAGADGVAWFYGGGEMETPLSEELPDPSKDMTYSVRPGEVKDGSFTVALFADNGNGLYASRAIAKQIVSSKLPYAFHLGDVYYGGTQTEVDEYFRAPLEPMFDDTELFMITGNHEMYARGKWFNRMIRRKAIDHPARQRQKGQTFRLCGDGFQIIGLDSMFVGWKSGRLRKDDFIDDDGLAVLRGWLQERPNDLTILLTTNHAWDKGSRKPTRLYESLRGTIAGRVDLWFWGNVHYAALYDMWPFNDTGTPLRRMVTSCIGHGGYPFYTESSVGALPPPLMCRWLETKPRFYPDASIRGEVGLNGWCKMQLTRESDGWNIGLTYIDWLGRERCRARLGRKDAGSVYFKGVEESEIATVATEPRWVARPIGSFR